MGLAIDGLYISFPVGTTIDYMEDTVTGTGTGTFRDEILEAGKGLGTWDMDNISFGDLRGIHKPVPAINGPSGFQQTINNTLIGDPSNTAPAGAGNFEVTGYSAYDNIGDQFSGVQGNNIQFGGGL